MGVRIDWRRWRWRRILVRSLAAIVAVPATYFLAALILGLVPANWGWREAPAGITIFVRSNGVHTWIMMPAANPIMDWRPYAPAAHLRDPRYGGNHLAFGYGNRDFYLETPTWGDLTVHNALSAAFGRGPSLMHVDHDHDPRPNEYQRPITVTPDEYRRLAAYVRSSFRLDGRGRTMPLIGRGYGPSDMFYEADGSYNLFLTCNEWTGRALRAAGVRAGLWTPFEQSIMWRLD